MADTHPSIRDGMIHSAVETRRVDDTKILQKVNAVNREAFIQKFPGQLEHSMRLVSERLMHCLNKPPGIELGDPLSWAASPDDIFALCTALKNLNEVHRDWRRHTAE
jgi:hypothetical protein